MQPEISSRQVGRDSSRLIHEFLHLSPLVGSQVLQLQQWQKTPESELMG